MQPARSWWRPGRVTLRLLVAGLAIVLTACSSSPGPTPSVRELSSGEVSDSGVTMRVTVEPAVVGTGEPIEVETLLEVDGRDALLVTGSGSGIVGFSVTRIEDGLTSGPPASSGDCARHLLRADEPMVVPFTKSGGWSPDDPNADFLRAYFAEPELTLPPGTWRIDAAVQATIGEDCTGQPLDLSLGLLVTVTE